MMFSKDILAMILARHRHTSSHFKPSIEPRKQLGRIGSSQVSVYFVSRNHYSPRPSVDEDQAQLPTTQQHFRYRSSDTDNSVFVLLVLPGNDIVNSFSRNDPITVIPEIFKTYDKSVNQLYAIEARKFIFNNLPDLPKTTEITAAAAANGMKSAIGTAKQQVELCNEQVICLADRTPSKYQGVTIFQPDVYSVFANVFTDPKSHLETANITKTYSPCPVSNRFLPTNLPRSQKLHHIISLSQQSNSNPLKVFAGAEIGVQIWRSYLNLTQVFESNNVDRPKVFCFSSPNFQKSNQGGRLPDSYTQC
ncbi:hypothetical protein VTL71DRAFT_15414 [Oculimacula yallundae]|uniref:Uncharacterized protein n=1 Tax=Oculimacula yallundae TaxID=86028 RepID=A0ABR4CIL2_9HELO